MKNRPTHVKVAVDIAGKVITKAGEGLILLVNAKDNAGTDIVIGGEIDITENLAALFIHLMRKHPNKQAAYDVLRDALHKAGQVIIAEEKAQAAEGGGHP